jgi:hypothetical protein
VSSHWTYRELTARRQGSFRTSLAADGLGACVWILLGRSHGLPRACSGHNGFSEWGQPAASDTHALVVGYDNPTDARPELDRCRRLATIDDCVGLANQEQGPPLLLCRTTAP